MPDRLTRDLQNGLIGGVCAGVARRYGQDATLVRVVYLLLTLVSAGVTVPLYVAAWIIMPREGATLVPPATAPDSDAHGMDAGTPEETTERVTDEMRRVGDRLSEAARVLAGKTREAAEEVSEIARRQRPGSPAAPPSPPWPPLEQDPRIYQHGQPPTYRRDQQQ
ncbi:MAG: PspC domain-containing protein [Dehalococcoidia bacterium]